MQDKANEQVQVYNCEESPDKGIRAELAKDYYQFKAGTKLKSMGENADGLYKVSYFNSTSEKEECFNIQAEYLIFPRI